MCTAHVCCGMKRTHCLYLHEFIYPSFPMPTWLVALEGVGVCEGVSSEEVCGVGDRKAEHEVALAPRKAVATTVPVRTGALPSPQENSRLVTDVVCLVCFFSPIPLRGMALSLSR